ncbi:macro domain-containing protein lmo2759-like [Mytilus edulis]|uniref:macro domain-containing protein lmo2759-like n=1 Tax=Mytilus edulis TaxID=6550 RepID=UPI0039F0B5C8
MAFASSIRKGQIPVGCELCKGQNKIQFKCVDCDLLMCSECKSRIHFRIAKDHQITDIKNIGKHAIFSEIKCENHIGQACCLFCQTCKTFICPKCITEVHNGHELIAEEDYNKAKVQQVGVRGNRKFASPDEVGPGPVFSPSSTSDLTISGGMTFKTKEGIKIFVYSAGIGNLKVETLVNAANDNLMHGGGIAYHISSAAGYALDKECDDYVQYNGPLSVGTCCSTTAGQLPYKSIIYAVGPKWYSYQHDRKHHCLDDLKKTILSALEEAELCKFRSIAIPSISSGIFGVPKELCAKQYFRAVVEYSRSSPSSSVREIHFIDKDKGMCNLVQKTFEKEFGYKGQQM